MSYELKHSIQSLLDVWMLCQLLCSKIRSGVQYDIPFHARHGKMPRFRNRVLPASHGCQDDMCLGSEIRVRNRCDCGGSPGLGWQSRVITDVRVHNKDGVVGLDYLASETPKPLKLMNIA